MKMLVSLESCGGETRMAWIRASVECSVVREVGKDIGKSF